MTKEKKETKCDDLIDALLEEHGISQEAVLGENGLSDLSSKTRARLFVS
jgi:hypothetical protein